LRAGRRWAEQRGVVRDDAAGAAVGVAGAASPSADSTPSAGVAFSADAKREQKNEKKISLHFKNYKQINQHKILI